MTTTTQGAFKALIAGRRAYGDRRYGNRHLQQAGLLRRAASELADCRVYVVLEAARLAGVKNLTSGQLASPRSAENDDWLGDCQVPPSRHDRARERDALRALADTTLDVGERVAAAAREICDPTVELCAILQQRAVYGCDRFGDAYLHRDNLAEALEELADAHIFISLQAERLRHRDQYPDEIQRVLVVAQDAVDELAGRVDSVRALRDSDNARIGPREAA